MWWTADLLEDTSLRTAVLGMTGNAIQTLLRYRIGPEDLNYAVQGGNILYRVEFIPEGLARLSH